MDLVNRATLPQEFYEVTSSKLLVTPEPQYLHGRLFKAALSASFGGVQSLGMPIMGRQFGANGDAYQQPEEGRLILSDGLYDQSIMVVTELGKTPGHTIRMNRPNFANTTYTQASREVPSGKVIGTDPVKVLSDQVSVTIRRFAGPYNSNTNAVGPIGVDRFDGKFMLHSPAGIASLNLVRDFDRTLDAFVVKLFDQANLVVYPEGISDDSGFSSAGSDPFTWELLQSVERQMDEANIPYFPNGKRVLVLHPRQAEQITLDKEYQRLARYYPNQNPLFSGTYVADIGNWTIFKSNTLTKNLTGGGGSVPVYYAQAFGPGAVGAGVGELPRAAVHSNDNYGETAFVIWLLYAGFEVLDSRFIASIRTS